MGNSCGSNSGRQTGLELVGPRSINCHRGHDAQDYCVIVSIPPKTCEWFIPGRISDSTSVRRRDIRASNSMNPTLGHSRFPRLDRGRIQINEAMPGSLRTSGDVEAHRLLEHFEYSPFVIAWC